MRKATLCPSYCKKFASDTPEQNLRTTVMKLGYRMGSGSVSFALKITSPFMVACRLNPPILHPNLAILILTHFALADGGKCIERFWLIRAGLLIGTTVNLLTFL